MGVNDHTGPPGRQQPEGTVMADHMNNHDPQRSPAPDFLTVEEAARVLRIGRTSAYAQVHVFEHSGGADGLEAMRVGNQLRISRYRLEELLGGPITWPLPEPPTPTAAKTATTRPSRTSRSSGRSDRSRLFPI